MVAERKYQWWEHAWGVTFSTHTTVHVAILSCLWQLGTRWRAASVLIGFTYAVLMVYRHYHAPLDIALTTAAMLPELIVSFFPMRRIMALYRRKINYSRSNLRCRLFKIVPFCA
jgi:hypothetical protein